MTTLLPVPQQACLAEGTCLWPRLVWCGIAGLAEATLDFLRRDFPTLAFEPLPGGPPRALIAPERPAVIPAFVPAPDRPEAYRLAISPDRIAISAADPAGLFYAFQTLAELVAVQPAQLPCQTIRDWPTLAVRGIHLDLKGYQPTLDRLIEICRQLARYKVNCILLELEDKVRLQAAPEIAVPGAFLPAELTRLNDACRALQIEVIPKLQCLGHVDYLLNHPKYLHLAEAGHPFQFCPRHPGGLALWQAMHDEIVAAMPGGRYFHVGADETGNLGQCPVCQPHSKADSYMHRVAAALAHVQAAGRTPILWEDILRNLHGHLTPDEARRCWALGRNAVLMYWAYGYGGRNNVFPLLGDYLEAGLRIWGASGFSGCGPSWTQNIPPYAERYPNILAWNQAAAQHGLPGVMCTGWGKIGSADPPAEPIDACWLPMLYHAASAWNPYRADPLPTADAIASSFFGLPAATSLLEAHRQPLPPGLKPRRQIAAFRLLDSLSQMAAHERRRQSLLDAIQMYRQPLAAGTLADYRVKLVVDRLAAFRRDRAILIRQLRRHFRPLCQPSTIDLFIDSRFGIDEDLMAILQDLLPA